MDSVAPNDSSFYYCFPIASLQKLHDRLLPHVAHGTGGMRRGLLLPRQLHAHCLRSGQLPRPTRHDLVQKLVSRAHRDRRSGILIPF